MKNYESSKRIAEYLQIYKQNKKKEKEYTPACAEENILSECKDSEKKIYEELTVKIKDEKSKYSEKKKAITKSLEDIKGLITNVIEEQIKSDDRDTIEESLAFTGIGTVSFKSEKKYKYEGTPEQKRKLLFELIDRELYDTLDINEDKLILLSEKNKKELGNHIVGIKEYNEINIKIR